VLSQFKIMQVIL